MKKSFMTILIAVLAFAVLAAGCSNNSGNSSGDATGNNGNASAGNANSGDAGNGGGEQVTLTVWDFYGATTPIKPLIPQFEEQNPGIKIEFQAQPWDNYWDKLAAGASGGELPDLATTGLLWAPQYQVLGVYAGLNELSNNELNGKPIAEQFSQGMLEGASVDDELYGIPYDFDAYALYYRQDLLEEANVEGPPTNWGELVEYGKKLTKDTDGDGSADQFAFVVLPDWYHFEPFLYANGGKVLNEDNTKAVINSPEAVEALQFYADLVNKHKIAVNWTPDRGSYISGLKDGTIAMFQDGPYVMGLIKDSIPEHEGKWRIGKPLADEQMGTHLGGTYLSVFHDSEHKEEAWKFIEFLSTVENQVELYKTSGAAPANLDAHEEPELQAEDPFFGNEVPMTNFKEAVEISVSTPVIREWQEISTIISDAVSLSVMQEETPQEALDNAAEKINNLLQ